MTGVDWASASAAGHASVGSAIAAASAESGIGGTGMELATAGIASEHTARLHGTAGTHQRHDSEEVLTPERTGGADQA